MSEFGETGRVRVFPPAPGERPVSRPPAMFRNVRVELREHAALSRVWVDGEQWAVGSIMATADPRDGSTRITVSFYGTFDAEGPTEVRARLPEGWTVDADGWLVPPKDEK